MKILLVEDDIEISDMLKNFLSTENFEVTASYNGKDAMALQKAEAKANQVAGLVNQFFTLAKLEAGDMVMDDMENINISELCRENILDFYEILTRKDFNVDITLWH